MTQGLLFCTSHLHLFKDHDDEIKNDGKKNDSCLMESQKLDAES